MVWGMESIDTGIFNPDGEFQGERERLDALEQQMSSAERAKYAPMGYGAYIRDCLFKDRGPLADHELPRKFVLSRRPKELGSWIYLWGGVSAVNESLKDIIERLDPGVHQFWPLQLAMRRGYEHPDQYYGMMVLRHLDSFVPEQSDPKSWRSGEVDGVTVYTVREFTKKALAGLSLSADIFGSFHLWRERRLIRPIPILSDELEAEIQKAALRIPKRFQLKTV